LPIGWLYSEDGRVGVHEIGAYQDARIDAGELMPCVVEALGHGEFAWLDPA
jgi:hypothetical protein